MGLAGRLKANLRSLRGAWQPIRRRGFGWAATLGRVLPAAMALRAWRRLVRPVNQSLYGRWVNGPALARFLRGLPAQGPLPLYVVVMPDVLHFLLPCLALLRGHLPLVLVANGAHAWELGLLRQRLPEVPLFRLRCLPRSSVDHGAVISLLLEHSPRAFGIVDHDCYVFDPQLLDRLAPAPGECLVALFGDAHPHLGFELPLTHVMALDAAALRALMHEFGVDAGVARRAPPVVQAALLRLGLPADGYLKPYQRFHDTLHLLLALALDRGLKVRIPRSEADGALVHLGGTSIGSHHTKNLFALYLHLRFLELLGDEAIRRRYQHLVRPLRSSHEALQRHRPGDPGWELLPLIDDAVSRLRPALRRAWPDLPVPPGAPPP